jgi:LacI family transcriptional regulator
MTVFPGRDSQEGLSPGNSPVSAAIQNSERRGEWPEDFLGREALLALLRNLPTRNWKDLMDTSPSSSRVTLRDIAKAIGLSHAAVSLALRNSPEVGLDTRKRVQTVAREMGYQPNAMAAGLAKFKQDSKVKPIHNSLAWLNFWPEPARLRGFREFDRYWQGAASSAEKFGYRLEEFVVNRTTPLRRVEQILIARGITGVLLPPVGPSSVDWSEFDFRRFCPVRLGASSETPPVHVVGSNQTKNAMLAFQKVREKGYQRIGFIGESYRTWSYGAGFLWAQLIDVPPESRVPPFIFQASQSAKFQSALVRWLRKEKPDAIITDRSEVPSMLAKIGYRVPQDIGLAALTVLDCPIDAGISQNSQEIGRVAVLVALSLINDNAYGVPPVVRQILIEGNWVDGTSLPARG